MTYRQLRRYLQSQFGVTLSKVRNGYNVSNSDRSIPIDCLEDAIEVAEMLAYSE